MASTNKNTVDVDSLPGCAVPECSRRAFADASVPVFDGLKQHDEGKQDSASQKHTH